ncbi:MAG: hypothetical protein MAG431_01241 [Chloroflexi bacterium]|nr:hypothetical protein [Chloroflexota bacterium]
MFYAFNELEFTAQHKQILENTTIDPNSGPGTILKDFEAFLTYIQEEGLRITKKGNLPYSLLPELNALLENTIEHGLTRPQPRSFPPIWGLYLLLRASGLTHLEAAGSKSYLRINKDMKATWDAFNPTERYFSLLETWLLRGYPDILGERHIIGDFPRHLSTSMYFLTQIPAEGVSGERFEDHFFIEKYNLGLLRLFGIIDVKSAPPIKGEGWQIERIYFTPFGKALFMLLAHIIAENIEIILPYSGEERDSFGIFQPGCAPYFPEWVNHLGEVEKWTFREGAHVFKVSLGKIWRRIAIPAEQPMSILASAILESVEFDHDHLYQFSYKNNLGTTNEICHPYMDRGPSADEVQIGDVPLQPGQIMIYWFDFGDDWKFEVKLEKVDPDMDISEDTLLEEKGESPEQYPRWG